MKFLEVFLPKQFVLLMPTAKGIYFYSEQRKNGKVIRRYERELIESPAVLQERVAKSEKESPVTYMTLLDSEAKQGLLVKCKEAEGVELSSVEKLCVDQRWGIYMSKDDLFEAQKRYNNIGLDFLFSPYTLLYNFFQKKIEKSDGLYIMLTDEMIVSAVFKNNTMIFADKMMLHDQLALVESTQILETYSQNIQSVVKAFYEAKVDDTMFIEKIFIADTEDFDAALENQLEEVLFVDVEKQRIDLLHELVTLSEKELS